MNKIIYKYLLAAGAYDAVMHVIITMPVGAEILMEEKLCRKRLTKKVTVKPHNERNIRISVDHYADR